jgi:hypothetical protein
MNFIFMDKVYLCLFQPSKQFDPTFGKKCNNCRDKRDPSCILAIDPSKNIIVEYEI